jgi:hypothetical protein
VTPTHYLNVLQKKHWQSSYKQYKKDWVKEREEKQARKIVDAHWTRTKLI